MPYKVEPDKIPFKSDLTHITNEFDTPVRLFYHSIVTHPASACGERQERNLIKQTNKQINNILVGIFCIFSNAFFEVQGLYIVLQMRHHNQFIQEHYITC